MMEYYLPILIAGFGGGVVRGLVGFIKHQFSYKNVKFNAPYFFGMMFLSGVVGVLTAAAIREAGIPLLGGMMTPAIAFIVGYAGGDFLESVYKIIIGKSNLEIGSPSRFTVQHRVLHSGTQSF